MITRQSSTGSYSKFTDQELVKLAQDGDVHACEHLLYKYRGLVKTKTRSFFIIGAEREDLLQTGMIGLWQSIMDFSSDKDISFLSFARICIERHVITAIKTATRHKQSPLNNAISLEYCTEEGNSDFNLTDILVSGEDLDPEEQLLREEDRHLVCTALRDMLSNFEWDVLKQYHFGKSYQEIANTLNCSSKSVDNALGRIKRKVANRPYAEVIKS